CAARGGRRRGEGLRGPVRRQRGDRGDRGEGRPRGGLRLRRQEGRGVARGHAVGFGPRAQEQGREVHDRGHRRRQAVVRQGRGQRQGVAVRGQGRELPRGPVRGPRPGARRAQPDRLDPAAGRVADGGVEPWGRQGGGTGPRPGPPRRRRGRRRAGHRPHDRGRRRRDRAVNAPPPAASSARTTTLFLAFGIGTPVSVGLGVYARLHDATSFAFNLAGFSSGTAAKAWLATLAFALALVQLASALIMYGRIPVRAPHWIGTLHRWSGRAAVLVTVPVAVHCLYALGFETDAVRGLVHSIAGCFFYGAFVAKMLVLQR